MLVNAMDMSMPDVAAIEGATYAPLMQALTTGRDDSFSSPVERLFIAVNGPLTGAAPTRCARVCTRL